MSYNPITLILTDNNLIGPTYVDWKRNLDIVLTKNNLKNGITLIPNEKWVLLKYHLNNNQKSNTKHL